MTATLQPHQQRVVAEQQELAERIEKLTAFIAAPRFPEIVPRAEQERLRRQRAAMEAYDAVLLERIAAF
jgi:hypothetical protein